MMMIINRNSRNSRGSNTREQERNRVQFIRPFRSLAFLHHQNKYKDEERETEE